jgi:hypothetical protein
VPSLQISKLDAARRQLETAIRLYFSNGDPVSIHTLAAAGYSVIRDVSAARGAGPMLLKGQLVDDVRPDAKKMFRDKLNEAENFFKHADRDHKAVHTFDPSLTEVFLLDACDQYYRLTGEGLPLFKVYRSWFIANRPDIFAIEKLGKLKDVAPELVSLGRTEFFRQTLPLASGVQTWSGP